MGGSQHIVAGPRFYISRLRSPRRQQEKLPTPTHYLEMEMPLSIRSFDESTDDSSVEELSTIDSCYDKAELDLDQQHHEERQTSGQRKQVSFSNLEIREYSITVGDHPCCVSGCPLSLDWVYEKTNTDSIDHYEAIRPPRRSRAKLRTSDEERWFRLEESGYSDLELRRIRRKLHRERSCSAKVCERESETFFQPSVEG